MALGKDRLAYSTTDLHNFPYQVRSSNSAQRKISFFQPLLITVINCTVRAKDVLLTAVSTKIFMCPIGSDSEALVNGL